MRLSIFAVGAVCLGLALGGAGCSDDDDNGGGGTGGRGGSGGGSGGTGGGSGGAGGGAGGAGGASGDAGGDTGPSVTYAQVQPIFMAKCMPCHTTGAGTKFPINYADATKTVGIVAAGECGATTKVGDCTIIRIKSGSMPYNKMCKTDAGAPPDPSACLTAAEEATVQAWVNGGLKE